MILLRDSPDVVLGVLVRPPQHGQPICSVSEGPPPPSPPPPPSSPPPLPVVRDHYNFRRCGADRSGRVVGLRPLGGWWGDPHGGGDPGSEGGGSSGAVVRPVAHEGRELDVRRLELGRQGKLSGPRGARAGGTGSVRRRSNRIRNPSNRNPSNRNRSCNRNRSLTSDRWNRRNRNRMSERGRRRGRGHAVQPRLVVSVGMNKGRLILLMYVVHLEGEGLV